MVLVVSPLCDRCSGLVRICSSCWCCSAAWCLCVCLVLFRFSIFYAKKKLNSFQTNKKYEISTKIKLVRKNKRPYSKRMLQNLTLQRKFLRIPPELSFFLKFSPNSCSLASCVCVLLKYFAISRRKLVNPSLFYLLEE